VGEAVALELERGRISDFFFRCDQHQLPSPEVGRQFSADGFKQPGALQPCSHPLAIGWIDCDQSGGIGKIPGGQFEKITLGNCQGVGQSMALCAALEPATGLRIKIGGKNQWFCHRYEIVFSLPA